MVGERLIAVLVSSKTDRALTSCRGVSKKIVSDPLDIPGGW
jgi:hypothetical protein